MEAVLHSLMTKVNYLGEDKDDLKITLKFVQLGKHSLLQVAYLAAGTHRKSTYFLIFLLLLSSLLSSLDS